MTKRELNRFISFLEAAGAQMLSPTNEWEVIRFKGNDEIGIVYKNKYGQHKFCMQAEVAYHAFTNSIPYSACVAISKRKKRSVLLKSLLRRDGNECFYCGNVMNDGEETIEHLFPINQGGLNHIGNLALSHAECNKKAGHLPIVKKVLLRDKMRESDYEKRKFSSV